MFTINEEDIKKIVQPKTIKSKSNGCGTAPGNLVCFNQHMFETTYSANPALGDEMNVVQICYGLVGPNTVMIYMLEGVGEQLLRVRERFNKHDLQSEFLNVKCFERANLSWQILRKILTTQLCNKNLESD